MFIVSILIAGGAASGGVVGHAWGQQVAPSRVTPGSLRPAAPGAAPIEVPGGGATLAAPAGAAGLSVRVGQVAVEGTFPGFEGATAALVDPLRGKRVTVAELYAAANALEQAYAAAGYVLARVVIPPQRLADGGMVWLRVVDGVIERVDASAVPERQRAVVVSRLAGIVGEPHVSLAEIERRLLLVSDLPGLQLHSTLAPGSTAGGTLLVVEATQNLVTGSVGIDDRLPKSLGTWAVNSTAALNDAFGFGEQAYFSYSSNPDLGSPRLRVMGGGVVLPLGNDGFTINPEYTESIAHPIPSPGAPATSGDFKRFALRASYPLVRTRTETLSLSGTAEWDDETLTAIGFGTKLYEDDYGAGRVAVHDARDLSWGASMTLDGTYSHGLAGRDGTSALPLSQQGANPVFNKFDGVARLRQPLPEAFEVDLVGRGQTSLGTPLMLSEQFGLDGADALSGFASGTFSVDEGLSVRMELARPFPFTLAGMPALGLSPYVFGAFGYGRLDQPTAVQRGSIDAGSAGVGMRSGTAAVATGLPVGSTLAVELARRFSDVPGLRDRYRVNVAANITF